MKRDKNFNSNKNFANWLELKGIKSRAFHESSSHSFTLKPQSVSCYATQMNAPTLNPAGQAGTRFTNPGKIEGWVNLRG